SDAAWARELGRVAWPWPLPAFRATQRLARRRAQPHILAAARAAAQSTGMQPPGPYPSVPGCGANTRSTHSPKDST
ncbi:MAG TPA: hypothetical protein VF415_00930, partial [Rhodanobacter sp.]